MSAGPTDRPQLSVVVVSFNSRHVLGDCLTGLGESPMTEVIVVDNASNDGSAEFVESAFSWARVIRSNVNGGFATAVHIGVAEARGRVVCLLNPDAVVATDSLLLLARRFDREQSLGVLAPLIAQPQGRLRIVSAGHLPSAWRMFTHYSGLSRLGRWLPQLEGHYLFPDQVMRERSVGWVTGACMLFRRDIWDEVGGLSRRWFMYAEDIEFCGRVQESGYQVRIDPSVVASHLVGNSTKTAGSPVNSAWIVNLYEYYSSDLAPGLWRRALWAMIVSSGLLARSWAYAMRHLSSRDDIWRVEARRFRVYAVDLARRVIRDFLGGRNERR